jgi:hypothetical protein
VRADRAPAAAPDLSPPAYAGEALLDLYDGREPWPPLSWEQQRLLARGGFICLRGDDIRLTAKGEHLVMDMLAEREWMRAHAAAALKASASAGGR